jgi:hypothetical protein
MSEFSPEEIATIAAGGNAKHNALWLGSYDPSRDLPEPSGQDSGKLREWLEKKYGAKKWFVDPNAPPPAEPEPTSASRWSSSSDSSSDSRSNTTSSSPASAAAAVKSLATKGKLEKMDPSQWSKLKTKPATAAAPAPSHPAAAAAAAQEVDFFGTAATPVPAVASAGGFGDFDAFGTSAASAPSNGFVKVADGFGDFGSPAVAPAAAAGGFGDFDSPAAAPAAPAAAAVGFGDFGAPAAAFASFPALGPGGGGGFGAFGTPAKPLGAASGLGGVGSPAVPVAAPVAVPPAARDPFASFAADPFAAPPAASNPFGAGDPFARGGGLPTAAAPPLQPMPSHAPAPLPVRQLPSQPHRPVAFAAPASVLEDPFASIRLSPSPGPAGRSGAKFEVGEDAVYTDGSGHAWVAEVRKWRSIARWRHSFFKKQAHRRVTTGHVHMHTFTVLTGQRSTGTTPAISHVPSQHARPSSDTLAGAQGALG